MAQTGCVSCGACVSRPARPTRSREVDAGKRAGGRALYGQSPAGYCGVGCSLKAEVKGDQVVRMLPNKDCGCRITAIPASRDASRGATSPHPDRVLTPTGGAQKTTRPVAQKCRGKRPIGGRGETSLKRNPVPSPAAARFWLYHSRRAGTNEETYLVQKMVRGRRSATTTLDILRARVCHLPTGYGLNHQVSVMFVGTQDFDSVRRRPT